MKKAALLLFLVLTVSFGFGQTTLIAGDLAITGVNSGIPGDDTDQFSFVLFTDVVSGTEINFTDCGWLATGGFRNYNAIDSSIAEGIITWTATSNLSCGTEIIITDLVITTSNVYTATLGDVVQTDPDFALSRDGDQIFAFQGSTLTPSFLFGLHFATNTSWTDALDENSSSIPSGLTNSVNAITKNLDNVVYKYNVTGNKPLILAALVNPAEWIASNTSFQTLGLPSEASFVCSTTILKEGDVAITGVNTDDPDEFSFVLLTDVVVGTEVNFTDCGWLRTGSFRNYNFSDSNGGTIGEGIIKWIATSDLNCGTEIIIAETDDGSNIYTANFGTVQETQNGFGLEAQGDQIIAFVGTITAPKFLYASHFANNFGFSDPLDPNGHRKSSVPAGLTEGVNAVSLDALNRDNSIYNYTVTDNQSLILAALADPSNWSGSNGKRQNLGLPTGVFFKCTNSGDCFGTVTWISPGLWDGSTPTISTNVVIDANYNTGTSPSFSACSITISGGSTLTVANDTFIIVENSITLNGDIIVETRGNFIQNDEGGAIIDAGGSCILNKTTPIKQAWYYYTYWSSPVADETIGSVFPNVPYDWKYSFNAANFVDNNGDDIDDNGNDWEFAAAADIMIPGVGYAIAGEISSTASYPSADNISFTGTFNTGDINVPITFDPTNSGMRWNFIGNPYPGAIDFVAFHLANARVLEGAAYFWSQASPPDAGNPGNNAENLNLNDYAVFTVGTGGAAGASGIEPNGYVASGQGFFIPALDMGTATFNNSMRVADGSSNNQFFKSSNSKKSSASATNPLENRLWVNLTTDNGVFNQILVGYVDKATDAYDGMAYDAPKLLNPSFAAALYSQIENEDNRYVIQGKAINSISEDEIIKLGFISAISADSPFKLSAEQFQGSFLTDNPIYLKDNLLDTTHNLTEADYAFTSEPGEFNSRFEIVFSVQSLSTDDNVLDNNALKIIQLDNDHVKFTVSDNLSIKSVRVFDLLGRELYNLKGSNSSETYNLSNLKDAIYIAKVELSNGAILTKKALKK